MIWQKKCNECKRIYDFKDCPYCRKIKKSGSDGNKS